MCMGFESAAGRSYGGHPKYINIKWNLLWTSTTSPQSSLYPIEILIQMRTPDSRWVRVSQSFVNLFQVVVVFVVEKVHLVDKQQQRPQQHRRP